MAATLSPPQIIPLTSAPSQTVNVTLGGQVCRINVYTKSFNVPIYAEPPANPPLPFGPAGPTAIPTEPPAYENINPVFLDLYVNDSLIIGGVLCRNSSMIVIDPYLGFVGDLSIIDTWGLWEDPYGVPVTLPPPDLRNWWQRNFPLSVGGKAPPSAGPGTIPGLGARWQLTYWPNLR